jgi:hypothetical protein
MLLKTPDNRDQGRIVLRVEKKLRPKADAVLYGFFGTVIKELMRGLMAVLRRCGDLGWRRYGIRPSAGDLPGFPGLCCLRFFGDLLRGMLEISFGY